MIRRHSGTNTVFVGSTEYDDWSAYALDATDSSQRGRCETDDIVAESSPTVVDGTAFIGSYDGY